MTSPNQMADPFVSTPDRRTQLVSFDLYERYSLAAQFVSALRGASPYAVLDVGGHSDVLWPGFGSLASAFIPDVKTFVIDLHREPGLKDYAVGSALSLPFSDRSFEFVLAADTLEHIAAADRQSFLHELLRVARGAVLLSFPFRTPLNEACERLVYRYIQMRKQVELPALREHLELGLPEIETVRQWVEETGLAFRIWNHGNTMLWLRMMLTKNHLWAQGAPEFGQELDAIFNVSFAAGDYREPCYRAFVAVSKEPGNDAVILNGIDGFRPGRLRAEDHDALFDLCGKIMESTSSLEVERRTQHSINIIEALGRSLEGQAERDKGHYECLIEEQRQRADAENRLREAASQLAHQKNLSEEQRQRAQDAENRLAEAASQAGHYKNLSEEQGQRAQDAENRLAEMASQLAHHKNLSEEQRQRAQDAENRLEETASQLAHHKNLSEEQRQRAQDAENRLAEAASQLAHHKNLSEEQGQRAQDAENRLEEAASQLAHHKNLSEELGQRAQDAENRLAETSSQLAHHKNLSEEQGQRAQDAGNRLEETSSQLAHQKNLSEEQGQRAQDAENRLAEASSQLAHHKNLSEEQGQRAQDVENRLAEASSQLAHHKNLTEEQRQRAQDAENRLAEAASQAGHYKDLSEEQQRRAEGAESRLQEVTSHPLRFALSTIGSRPRV
jgi:ubiquinone/menaquinone biosynthesis C-methylase UbiE